MTKRITMEMIRTAFKETGLKPVKGFVYNEGSSCGLGALYAMERGIGKLELATFKDVYSYFDKKFGEDYVRGFWFGFDNFAYSNYAGHTYQHKLGYKDGQRIGLEIFNGNKHPVG